MFGGRTTPPPPPPRRRGSTDGRREGRGIAKTDCELQQYGALGVFFLEGNVGGRGVSDDVRFRASGEGVVEVVNRDEMSMCVLAWML